MKEILEWLPRGANHLASASYWNDVREEEGKPFDLHCGGKEKLIRYLGNETGLLSDFFQLMELARELGQFPQGQGVDMAAGAGWGTALLSRFPDVTKITAVDFSRHRLVDLAPAVFEALGADTSKIDRAVGSFYEVRLPSGSIDFCFLSQAFHHADNPLRLLGEAGRLLRPGGNIYILGEEPISFTRIAHQWALNMTKRLLPQTGHWRPPVRKLFPSFRELFPADTVLGDNYYRFDDYLNIYQRAGFRVEFIRISHRAIFLLNKL